MSTMFGTLKCGSVQSNIQDCLNSSWVICTYFYLLQKPFVHIIFRVNYTFTFMYLE